MPGGLGADEDCGPVAQAETSRIQNEDFLSSIAHLIPADEVPAGKGVCCFLNNTYSRSQPQITG